jgi:hypothetical protein
LYLFIVFFSLFFDLVDISKPLRKEHILGVFAKWMQGEYSKDPKEAKEQEQKEKEQKVSKGSQESE